MEKRQQQEQEEKRELVPIEEEGEDYTLHVVLFFGGSVPLVALTQLAGLGITGFVGAAVVAALLAVSGPELVKRLLQGNRFPGLDWQRLSLALSYASDERYVVDADLVDEPDEGLVQEDGDELQVTKPEQQKGQQGPWVPAQFMLDDVLDIVHLFNKKHAVYFGDSEHGAIAIPLRVMYHVIDVSSSGKGKSNRFRLAMIQMVNHCETYYINPFAANVKAVTDDRKIEVWKPIFDRLANKRPVKEGPDILRLMTALVNEIESRNDQEGAGDFSWREKPIFILIDELPEVFARCPQAIELLDKIGRTGRQFCVFCWVASQTAQVKDIGLSTASQAQFKTRIYGGGDKTSSDRVMKGSIAKEDEKTLQTNGAGLTLLLADGFSDQAFVRAPLITNEALFAYFGLPPFQIEEWIAPAKTVSRQPVAASKGRAQEDDPLAENYINADTDLVDDDPLEPYTPVTRNATGVAEALSDDFEHSSNVRVTRNATLPAGWTEKDVELATLIYKNLRNKDQCLKAIGKATSQDNRRVLSSILQEEE